MKSTRYNKSIVIRLDKPLLKKCKSYLKSKDGKYRFNSNLSTMVRGSLNRTIEKNWSENELDLIPRMPSNLLIWFIFIVLFHFWT